MDRTLAAPRVQLAEPLTGPSAAGWLFETTGSYYIAFAAVAALYAGATLFSLFLRPPRP